MRDVTLYEDDRGVLRLHRRTDAQLPVPAVVGKTVADFEQLERERDEALAETETVEHVARLRVTKAERERDKALKEADHLRSGLRTWVRAAQDAQAERDNLSVEAHHWMAEAARYREALERIRNVTNWRHIAAEAQKDACRIAREALGGGDD